MLFDSSVYIAALRSGNPSILSLPDHERVESVWLSAVVLEELYAGSQERDRHTIELLERDFAKMDRLLVPDLSDWALAGQTLARLGAKYGYEEMGRSRLTNETLIAMSAARKGILVVTKNLRDFARIAEFRPFRWKAL